MQNSPEKIIAGAIIKHNKDAQIAPVKMQEFTYHQINTIANALREISPGLRRISMSIKFFQRG